MYRSPAKRSMTSSMEENIAPSFVAPRSWRAFPRRKMVADATMQGGVTQFVYTPRMCTLAVYVRQFADTPLVVAANRDEFFARPATPPELLTTAAPRIVGGRDLRAGGTWLGIN